MFANASVTHVTSPRNAGSTVLSELRLSLGAEVWFPETSTSLSELVRRADELLYVDKQSRPHRAQGVVRLPVQREAVTS